MATRTWLVLTLAVLCLAASGIARADLPPSPRDLALVPGLLREGRAWVSRGDLGDSRRAIYELPDRLMQMWRLQSDAGDVLGANQTLARAIRAADDEPNVSDKVAALEWIALSQAHTGDAAETRVIFAFAKKIAADMPRNEAKQSALLSDIAQEQVLAGDIAGAMLTARAITAAFPRALALCAIAEGQVRAKDVTSAVQTFAQARASAVLVLTGRDKDELLGRLASDEADAGVLPDDTPEGGAKDRHVLCLITLVRARRGDIAGALHAAVQIKNPMYQADAIQTIANTQMNTGDFAGAQETAERLPSGHYKVSFLRSIATARAAAGSIADALRGASALTDPADKADALYAVALRQANTGDADGAEKTLALAIKSARDILDGSRHFNVRVDDSHIWNAIAAARARTGDLAGAMRIVGAATASHRSELLSRIAQAQAERGDFAGARRTVALIPSRGDQARLLDDFAEEQIKAGNFAQAREMLQGEKRTLTAADDNDYRAEILNQVGENERLAGDARSARGTLIAAQSATDNITNAETRIHLRTEIAKARARCGDAAGAKAAAESMKPATDRDAVFAAVAAVQEGAGDFAEAAATVAQINDRRMKACASARLAAAIRTVQVGSTPETAKGNDAGKP